MKLFTPLSTAYLVIAAIASAAVEGPTTPCFIPLPELALTDSLNDAVSSASRRSSKPDETIHSASECVVKTRKQVGGEKNAVELKGSEGEDEQATLNDKNSEIKNATANETVTDSTAISPAHTIQTSCSTASASEGICTPYCAALDSLGKCVNIKGCGYPEGGNFGKHGCCPPTYMSGTQVLALVVFVVLVTVICMPQ